MIPRLTTANNWKTTLFFISFVTILTAAIAWLIQGDILPLKLTIDYSIQESQFIRFWLKLALVIGVLFPLIGFFLWIAEYEIRKLWSFYLLVIAFQIATEFMFSRLFFPSIVVIVGTFYTAFRLWQLWEGKILIANHHFFVQSLLWIVLLFWLANVVVLLTLSWFIIL